jgi:hypothetical protein
MYNLLPARSATVREITKPPGKTPANPYKT